MVGNQSSRHVVNPVILMLPHFMAQAICSLAATASTFIRSLKIYLSCKLYTHFGYVFPNARKNIFAIHQNAWKSKALAP
jgi:hypothetical protein